MPELSDDEVFGKGPAAPPQELTDEHIFGGDIGTPGSPSAMWAQMKNENPDPKFMPKTARVEQGLADPFYAGYQLAAHVVPGMDSAAADKKVSDRETVYQATRREAGQTGTDWLRMGGNIAGMAPAAILAPAEASVFGATTMGALTGALTPSPYADNFWKEKGKQTGFGALTGLIMGVLSKGASSAISPNPSASVSLLQNEGVTPTMGQLMGETGAVIEDVVNPFSVFGQRRAVQQLNRAAYNRALTSVGEALGDVPGLPKMKFEGNLKNVGYDGVKQVGDKLSAAYEHVLPRLSFSPAQDAQFGADLQGVLQSTATMTEPKAKQFNAILKTYLDPKIASGQLSGDELKQLESQIGNQVAHFKGPNASPDDLQMAGALEDVLTAVRESVERTNPNDAPKLRAINNGWAILTRIENSVKTNSKDGVFTPAQLMQSVRQSDSSVRHRQFARGDALLQDLAVAGKKVLGNDYPNSGTPARAAAMALAAGGTGVVSNINPGIGGLMALQSMSYTPLGQRVVSGLATRRSGQVLPLLSQGVRRAAPTLQSGAVRNLLSADEPVNLLGE